MQRLAPTQVAQARQFVREARAIPGEYRVIQVRTVVLADELRAAQLRRKSDVNVVAWDELGNCWCLLANGQRLQLTAEEFEGRTL